MKTNSEVVVISTAYKPDPEWRRNCELSVLTQTVPVQHIYLDGAETGCTSIEQIWSVIHGLDPATVVLSVDGDDWLAHDRVVEQILARYDQGAWMTWGNYAIWQHDAITPAPPDADDVTNRRMCRKLPWFASHLKTYRAGLFQQILVSDLRDTDGYWITECTDLATMWPMLEMADDRGRHIQDILYVYNHTNPRSVHNIGGDRLEYQRSEARRMRAMPSYSRLSRTPW